MALWLPVCCEHANAPQTAVFSQRIKRTLLTAYPFVTGEKSPDVMRYFMRSFKGNFMILDSGIFTLMKDQAQGKGLAAREIVDYTKRYIKLIKGLDYKYPFIEVDAHYIGGLDLLPQLRQMFIDAGLQRQVIPVWHEPEGVGAWEKLVEAFPRVSLSAREWEPSRALKIINHLIFKARHLIPRRHVHILGTSTDAHLSRPDNFSCDATSWNTVVLFGETKLKGWPSVSLKNGVLTAPSHIQEAVDADFNGMQNVYRFHPETRAGMRIRRPYVRALAAALYHCVEYYEAMRKKNPASDFTIADPLEYGERHAIH